MRFYHVFYGPVLLFRGSVQPVPENVKVSIVQDFYRGKVTKTDVQDQFVLDQQYRDAVAAIEKGQITKASSTDSPDDATPKEVDKREPFYRSPKAFWLFLKRTVLYGMFVDVVDEQNRSNGSKLDDILAKNIQEVHSYAHKFDNKVEYLYSMLQVFTATTTSFAHGYAPTIIILIPDPTTFLMPWPH